MKAIKLTAIVSMAVFTALLVALVAAHGYSFQLPASSLRLLALEYIRLTLNPVSKLFTASAPEAVTAIVWDFRGLDTLFETTVFYLAIIGCLALMRGLKLEFKGGEGLSVIAKAATRVTIPGIIAVAASLALHGQLTPGGGFQAGSTAAVVFVLLIVVFSLSAMGRLQKTSSRLILIRCLGLVGVAVVALAVTAITLGSGYVFQNQPKPGAPVGYPGYVLGVPSGGSLIFFNVFECMAVMAGFALVFILLACAERR